MGATDPAQAAEGTLRKEFGTSISHNGLHGSDSIESAFREINFFFSTLELIDF
jgi:nucleoside-diphosphate kinase